MSKIKPPNVLRADSDGFHAECPECRQFIKIEMVEYDLGEDSTGRHLGSHAEPDLAAYEAHYTSEHEQGAGHG